MALFTGDECKYIVDCYDDSGMEIRDKSLSLEQMLEVARMLVLMNDTRYIRLINAINRRLSVCGPNDITVLMKSNYKRGEFYKLPDEERLG